MFNLVRVLKAKTLEDLNKAGNAKSVLEIPNVNSYQLLLFTMIGPKTQINQFPTDIQAVTREKVTTPQTFLLL